MGIQKSTDNHNNAWDAFWASVGNGILWVVILVVFAFVLFH